MAEFANQTITIAGRKLIADSIAQKKPVTFTRIEIGDGQPPTDPETLTAPVHKIFELPVTTVRSVPDYPGLWLVTTSFVAREEKGDFYFREAAIYGKFDTEDAEVLVAYLNSEDTADYIKAVSAKSQMQVDLTFAIVLGNTPVLTVTNPAGLLTLEDFDRLQDQVKADLAKQDSDIQNFKDSTLADLQNAKDSLLQATKKFVLKAGDTMTGALNIPAHALTAKDIKSTATLTGVTATFSGALAAASAKLTGDLTLRNGTASGDLKAANLRGNLVGGTVSGTTATFSGLITGNLKGNLTGNVTGNVKGNLTGSVTGGTITGTTATLSGDVKAANLRGNLIGGTVSGTTATFSGLITGNLKGNVTGGIITGTTATLSGDVKAANLRGNLIGGTVTGTTATFSGLITGNLKGNVTATNITSTFGDVEQLTVDLLTVKTSVVVPTVYGSIQGDSGQLDLVQSDLIQSDSGQIATLSGTTATFKGDVTAVNLRGNLVGGTVSGTTGNFSGIVSAKEFRGNLTGGDLMANTARIQNDVTAQSFWGKWQTLSIYPGGGDFPGRPNLETSTIPQLANAIVVPGIGYHAATNSNNPNIPERTGILELRHIGYKFTACYFTSPTGTTYTGFVNDSIFSGWQNTNGSAAVPPGSIIAFASATPPAGWLLCDGRSLSTTAYQALFNAIRYTWGGSGSNFKIPDARGQFLRGHDNGRNLDKSRAFGSSQTSGAPNITGEYAADELTHTVAPRVKGAFTGPRDTEARYVSTGIDGGPIYKIVFDASRASSVYQSGLAEVRPTNIAVAYIIKY